MATKIKWSAHRSDSKIGTTEVIEDEHRAQRLVETGQATYVDDEPPAEKPPTAVSKPVTNAPDKPPTPTVP